MHSPASNTGRHGRSQIGCSTRTDFRKGIPIRDVRRARRPAAGVPPLREHVPGWCRRRIMPGGCTTCVRGRLLPVPDDWFTVDASAWTLAGVEQQGLHAHEWYRYESEPRTWLFKPARPERHRAIGEDIVEKVASELARLLGVPAARVELAEKGAVRGVLVEDARPPGWELQHGRVLMSEAVEAYDPDDHEHRGHSPLAIQSALGRFGAPPSGDLPPDLAAYDVFAGYLVFDALIAHVDRHDRNWAVLVPPPGNESPDALCASFDHAASLGFTLSEAECAEHLRATSVARWASQGKARRFEHAHGTSWQSLVALAGAASRLCRDDVRAYWRDRVLSVDRDSVISIVSAAPGLADITLEFVVELVMANRRRLLDELR